MTAPLGTDEFELYDLRVEVVGPPDATIYCGARLGDHFELQGEMLILPPGQGFSIYSLAARRSPVPIPTARPASASPAPAGDASATTRSPPSR
jgi:hypothetical protein